MWDWEVPKFFFSVSKGAFLCWLKKNAILKEHCLYLPNNQMKTSLGVCFLQPQETAYAYPLTFLKNEKETWCEVLTITSVTALFLIHFRKCTISSQYTSCICCDMTSGSKSASNYMPTKSMWLGSCCVKNAKYFAWFCCSMEEGQKHSYV